MLGQTNMTKKEMLMYISHILKSNILVLEIKLFPYYCQFNFKHFYQNIQYDDKYDQEYWCFSDNKGNLY